MRTLFAVLALVPAVETLADDRPEHVKKFMGDASNCRPSCYDGEDPVPWGDTPFKRVCGYKDWNFQQTQIRGKWTPLESRGIPAVEATVTACKFPKDGGGIAKQARAAFASIKGDLKDLAFVPQGTWTTERNGNLDPVRWQTVRIYASNWEQKPSECGGPAGRVVCEASGSKGAKAFNYIRYRLDEAKQWEKKEPEACQISTFFAVATARGVKKFREGRIAKKQWTPGLLYKTRYEGELDEKALFAKVDEYEKEALALHKKCGGTVPLVTHVKSSLMYTEPEFEMVPNPDEE